MTKLVQTAKKVFLYLRCARTESLRSPLVPNAEVSSINKGCTPVLYSQCQLVTEDTLYKLEHVDAAIVVFVIQFEELLRQGAHRKAERNAKLLKAAGRKCYPLSVTTTETLFFNSNDFCIAGLKHAIKSCQILLCKRSPDNDTSMTPCVVSLRPANTFTWLRDTVHNQQPCKDRKGRTTLMRLS